MRTNVHRDVLSALIVLVMPIHTPTSKYGSRVSLSNYRSCDRPIRLVVNVGARKQTLVVSDRDPGGRVLYALKPETRYEILDQYSESGECSERDEKSQLSEVKNPVDLLWFCWFHDN